jgi:hypothetical protein
VFGLHESSQLSVSEEIRFRSKQIIQYRKIGGKKSFVPLRNVITRPFVPRELSYWYFPCSPNLRFLADSSRQGCGFKQQEALRCDQLEIINNKNKQLKY